MPKWIMHGGWVFVVVYFCFLSEAYACESGIDECTLKVDDANQPVPKQGRVLVQRRIQSKRSELADEIGNNGDRPSRPTYKNLTTVDAIAQLGINSSLTKKKCRAFDFVKGDTDWKGFPNGFGTILKLAGVNDKNENPHNDGGVKKCSSSPQIHFDTLRPSNRPEDEHLRNECISYIAKHSKISSGLWDAIRHYQSLWDYQLQEIAAGIITLKDSGYSDVQLRQMSSDDQRNALIVLVSKCIKKDFESLHSKLEWLQARTTFVLVQYMNDNTDCCPSGCKRDIHPPWSHGEDGWLNTDYDQEKRNGNWCVYQCYSQGENWVPASGQYGYTGWYFHPYCCKNVK